MLPVITKIELELNRKVFLPSQRKTMKAEFNTAAILRADKAAQAAYWNTMFQIGVATPNQISKEINLPRKEHGDHSFVQVNVQTLANAVKEKEVEEGKEKV